tara:strand:- start:909 stop:1130 length:222 start_codon:yes stop_codon:yes gene_type:complete
MTSITCHQVTKVTIGEKQFKSFRSAVGGELITYETMNIIIHQEDGHGISIDIGSPSYKSIDLVTDEFKVEEVV